MIITVIAIFVWVKYKKGQTRRFAPTNKLKWIIQMNPDSDVFYRPRINKLSNSFKLICVQVGRPWLH